MDKERVRAEVEAKVQAEQENEDVLLRKIQAQVNVHHTVQCRGGALYGGYRALDYSSMSCCNSSLRIVAP